MTLSPNEESPAKGVVIKSFHHKKKKFFWLECFSPLTEAQDSLWHTHTYTLQPPMLSSLGQL